MLRVQRYVSDELTHFVGQSKLSDLEAQYVLFLKIIHGGWLTHAPHDPTVSGNLTVRPHAKVSENEMYIPQVVCFCDIPAEDLGLHSSKYGRFGLAFKKNFLIAQGASPVFYLGKNSVIWVPRESGQVDHSAPTTRERIMRRVARAVHFDQMVQAQHLAFQAQRDQMLKEFAEAVTGGPGISTASRIQWFLGAYIFAYMKFFDETKPDDDPENYYMEREWRVLGNVQFSLEDVSRVILPEEFAKRFRADVPDYYKQVTFI